jgi:hypothetical protein
VPSRAIRPIASIHAVVPTQLSRTSSLDTAGRGADDDDDDATASPRVSAATASAEMPARASMSRALASSAAAVAASTSTPRDARSLSASAVVSALASSSSSSTVVVARDLSLRRFRRPRAIVAFRGAVVVARSARHRADAAETRDARLAPPACDASIVRVVRSEK